ncbi:MAG: hypothetical protein K2H41_07865, partial [Acetatifactor sp.]|nr:hypothetical protein [Acetatifactor sp.]
AEKYGSFISDYEDFDPEEEFDEFACCYHENKLTELKKKLVERKMLAQRIDYLHLSDFLIMGNGDIQNNVGAQASVKEDLFEAIIGAIALDSDWNISEIQNAVDIMLEPDDYLSEDSSEDFIELIREWVSKKYETVPLYYFEETSMWHATYYISSNLPNGMVFYPTRNMSGLLSTNLPLNQMPPTGISTRAKEDCRFSCQLKLGEFEIDFRGFGASKSEARKDVCKLAYNYLEYKDLLFSIQDEIDNPNRNEAINQLEILARRGYFSLPTYEFEQEYDNNGNPVWKCICHINEKGKNFWSKASSKKDAKKNAAFGMLKYVLM